MSNPLPDNQRASLERLIRIAQGDSGQCRIVADFLLAWWDAGEYGGFNLTDVWAVDEKIAADMLSVIVMLRNSRCYPDSLGYSRQFQLIVQKMRRGSAKSVRSPAS